MRGTLLLGHLPLKSWSHQREPGSCPVLPMAVLLPARDSDDCLGAAQWIRVQANGFTCWLQSLNRQGLAFVAPRMFSLLEIINGVLGTEPSNNSSIHFGQGKNGRKNGCDYHHEAHDMSKKNTSKGKRSSAFSEVSIVRPAFLCHLWLFRVHPECMI